MSGALRPLPGYHLKQVNIARWNSDGLYLGSSSSDKQVKIGQLEGSGTLRQVQTIPMITNVTQIVWHPTETGRFCVAGDDKAIELWDVRASRATSKIQTLSFNLNVSWSPDGKYLAVGNSVAMTDNVIVVDIGQGKWFKRAKFGFEVNELSWTANSSHLLAATGEGTIDVLNADLENSASPDMSLVGSFTAHTSNCFALKVDRDFQRMAVGSADHNVSLWDLGDLVCHHTHSFDAPVRYLSFSGDGQRLAVVPEGSSVHILDSNSADPIRKVECEKTVTALCWHPKSPLLAVGVADVVTKATTTLPSFLKFVSLPANL